MLEDNDFFESQTQRSEEAPDSMPSEYREEEKEDKKGKKGTKSKEDSKEEPKKKGGRDYMSNDIGFPGSRRLANNGLLLFLNSVVSGNLPYFFNSSGEVSGCTWNFIYSSSWPRSVPGSL